MSGAVGAHLLIYPPTIPVRTAETLDAIIKVIAPYLGENMARASTRGQCDRLGIDGADMTPDQANALVERLTGGLVIFIGREKAAQVAQEMRGVLDDNGAAP